MTLLLIEREVNILGFLFKAVGITPKSRRDIPHDLYAIVITLSHRGVTSREELTRKEHRQELFSLGTDNNWSILRDKEIDTKIIMNDILRCIRLIAKSAEKRETAAVLLNCIRNNEALAPFVIEALGGHHDKTNECEDCGGGCACEDEEKDTKASKPIVSSRISKDKWPECPF